MKLKKNELETLRHLLAGLPFKEIAKNTCLNEVTIRRIAQRLKKRKIYSSLNLPDFAKLEYNFLVIQRLTVSSRFYLEINSILEDFRCHWPNCLDYKETIDNRLVIRSVWRSIDDFRRAKREFHQRKGKEWIKEESLDIIPLKEDEELIRISIP